MVIAQQLRLIYITLIIFFNTARYPRRINVDYTVVALEQGNRGPFVMETVKADDKAKLGGLFI